MNTSAKWRADWAHSVRHKPHVFRYNEDAREIVEEFERIHGALRLGPTLSGVFERAELRAENLCDNRETQALQKTQEWEDGVNKKLSAAEHAINVAYAVESERFRQGIDAILGKKQESFSSQEESISLDEQRAEQTRLSLVLAQRESVGRFWRQLR